VFGGDGDDDLDGRDGAQDFLNGGAGNDTVHADAGDIVTTGDGADVITYQVTANQTAAPADIVDFDPVQDTIVLDVQDVQNVGVTVTHIAPQTYAVSVNWITQILVKSDVPVDATMITLRGA
jgi:Ca2+-binding RTX toxin-like protein